MCYAISFHVFLNLLAVLCKNLLAILNRILFNSDISSAVSCLLPWPDNSRPVPAPDMISLVTLSWLLQGLGHIFHKY